MMMAAPVLLISASVPPTIRGVNYGGRFIPERWLNLPGMAELYNNTTPGCESSTPRPCVLSTCDLAATKGSGARVLRYLNNTIQRKDFQVIANKGFNFVRLPVGYWQLLDITTPPDGTPAQIARRWVALQTMLPAKAYRPYIERVLQYAGAAGLKVLLDLHGAPGGQSVNQCTGCATSCEGDGCPSDRYYFFTARNRKVAVAAVVELAKLCQAFRSSCYGVELLNEPAPTTPFGRKSSREASDGDRGSRDFLLEYYAEAIHAARTLGGLDLSAPLVIMDWPTWLGSYWADHALGLNQSIPLPGAGQLQFETHIYSPYQAKYLWELEAFAAPMFELVRRFTASTRMLAFIGEYALVNIAPPLQLEQVADWWYEQASASHEGMLGLSIWNYDGPKGWGAVLPNGANATRSWWPEINQS